MSKKSGGEKVLGGIASFLKTEKDYTIEYEGGEEAKLTILNHHVFRYYMSPTKQFLDYPIPCNPTDVARINSKNVNDYGTEAFDKSTVTFDSKSYIVETEEIKITFSIIKGTFKVYDKRVEKQVLIELEPIRYNDHKTTQMLLHNDKEYFFGGGMQNGRFTHKGEIIHIENTNNWVDGGVTSPSPFYWSTCGYGVLRNTWQSGHYDFGSSTPDIVATVHEERHIDVFYFINSKPRHILNDYYELTGQPIFMPEYAFYEAHLNTFNRDYWVEVKPDVNGAIQFEDGKFYKSYQPNEMGDKKGILESLNGEKNNYQFSARAMIDRYKKHDMPLGWFIPNDGYGSGYGQTDTLEGDLENLKEFIDYANTQGVEVALWTESNLEPEDPKNPKKGERDLSKEVGIGAVALKCDVAWIGEGYSFGLNAVEHATKIYVDRVKNKVRPLIIMVDGWAGTQRHAGIWSGDQTGGKWEYIRFHIPTYIGAGLSGLPIVGSDMDGIYGGSDREVNIRDYQWKTFTPLQLNMDGWGHVQKTPFSFDFEATTINRAYLKLKSMLLPYNYTIAHQSIHGLPMVRAMFLEFPNEEPAHTKDSQYQFMWGPSILVAPVYQKTESHDQLVRHGVYLPDRGQHWVDLFTGRKYRGGKVYNNIKSPLWKIPVFVREGAIIPFVNANNNLHEIKRDCRIINIYPNMAKKTEFDVYEDDGKSADYLNHRNAITKISVHGNEGNLFIDVHETEGHYDSIVKERTTLLRIHAPKDIRNVKAAINGESIDIINAQSIDFDKNNNSYYYDQRFLVNPYLEDFNINGELFQKFLLIKIDKTDVTKSKIQIKISGYKSNHDTTKIIGDHTVDISLQAPSNLSVPPNGITPTSITLQWQQKDPSRHHYEIERDGVIFSNIKGTTFSFEEFKSESEHSFRIRSAEDGKSSQWSDYLVVETGPDPYKKAVKGVSVTCNVPCQPNQEVCKLTENSLVSIWHTHWGMPGEADYENGKTIVLSFNLEDVYNIERIDYIPRDDAGNGTFLKIRYRFSVDGKNWSDVSPEISWEEDEKTKTIMLNDVRIKFFELNVLESVGGFGSGRNIFFLQKV